MSSVPKEGQNYTIRDGFRNENIQPSCPSCPSRPSHPSFRPGRLHYEENVIPGPMSQIKTSAFTCDLGSVIFIIWNAMCNFMEICFPRFMCPVNLIILT